MTAVTAPPQTEQLLADEPLRRLLAGIVTAMTSATVTVAALAFVASFGAIHDYAVSSGGLRPGHAWMAPLFVDSFIFIGASADLWTNMTRDLNRADRWRDRAAALGPKTLLIVAAAASYGLNIAHAPATVPARVVAALAPTALVVSEIIVMFVIRRAVAFRLTHYRQLTGVAGEEDVKVAAWRLLAAWDAAAVPVTGSLLAAQLGTSPRHARRLLADYRAAVSAEAVASNGRGVLDERDGAR